MEPENAIVKLCVAGRPAEALALYEQAWQTAVITTSASSKNESNGRAKAQ